MFSGLLREKHCAAMARSKMSLVLTAAVAMALCNSVAFVTEAPRREVHIPTALAPVISMMPWPKQL